MFVEVQSVEKNCPVIVNLDHIVEIAPLTNGHCVLFLDNDNGFASARPSIEVKDSYVMFKQFALTTVTAEQIESRFPKATSKKKTDSDIEVPQFVK
jgi:hypothetical protein